MKERVLHQSNAKYSLVSELRLLLNSRSFKKEPGYPGFFCDDLVIELVFDEEDSTS